MSVADKFGDGEKFNTVLNFSPRILYELATASDEIIQKVEDGEIKASTRGTLTTLTHSLARCRSSRLHTSLHYHY